MAERVGLGTKIASAFVDVGFAVSGFGTTLGSDITSSILSQTFIVGRALELFGQAVFKRFTVPLIAATTANIAQFQALDREIRTTLTLFGTAPSLVRDTFSTMAAGIRDVSESVGGLERDIADGLYQAISAGVPRGGVFDFLEIAQMAAMADRTADITTAVDGLTTVVNAFGLASTDAERAADVMFATVALGKTTFGELSTDIGRVAPLAANAGVKFEELFAIIGALTLQGLKTSESISFMRAAITGLLRPTDELGAVFERAGFASAEAAVPVIGLQAAFQLVVDAVGGSTSKLQELIGTSEGVSAILGVTGDNAEKFARGMDAVDNAAGAVARAFGIMDDSVGRTFGRLTEAFDRMGNTFGEMAARFVTPVFEKVTDVINNLVGIFEGWRPAAEGLAIAFTAMFSAFDIPILENIVTIFIAMAITVYGVIGALGLWALTAGKAIQAGLKMGTIALVLSKLKGAFKSTQKAMAAMGESIAESRIATKALSGPMGLLSKTTKAAGTGFKKMALTIPFATLAVFAIVAAIGAVVIAIGKYIERNKRYIETQDIFGRGVDKLAESLGVARLEFNNMARDAEGAITSFTAFADENFILVNRLRLTKEVLGDIAAIDLAEAFLIPLELDEAQLELAIEFLDRLVDIEIDLDFDTFEDLSAKSIELSEGVLVAARAFDELTKANHDFRVQADVVVDGLFDLFLATRASGDLDLFAETVRKATEGFNEHQLADFGKRMRDAFESGFDEPIDISGWFDSLGDFADPALIIRKLAEIGVNLLPEIVVPIIPEIQIPEGSDLGVITFEDFFDPDLASDIAELDAIVSEFGIHILDAGPIFAAGDFESTKDLIDDIGAAFDDAKEAAEDAFAAIATGIEKSMPLLGIYTGAVDQTFEAWQKGHLLYLADLDAITEVRGLLEERAPEIVDAFDAAQIGEQAWLAALGGENLDTVIEGLKDQFQEAQVNVDLRKQQSVDRILEGVQAPLMDVYNILKTEAETAGGEVASVFNTEFDTLAAQWVITAQTWIDEMTAIINTTIEGPVIGVPTFGGFTAGGFEGAGVINYTVTVIERPITSDLPGDLEAANLVAATNRAE